MAPLNDTPVAIPPSSVAAAAAAGGLEDQLFYYLPSTNDRFLAHKLASSCNRADPV